MAKIISTSWLCREKDYQELDKVKGSGTTSRTALKEISDVALSYGSDVDTVAF